MTESPLVDSGFVVPVFSLGVDPITCLNKAMAFLTVVSSSREDKVKFIMVLGIRVMLLVRGETMLVDKQGLLNATTVKVKDIWLGNALSLSDQGMQHDPGVPDGQVIQTIIPNNAAFQTEDLDTYDSNCDDILNAKAVLMANISNYGPDIISEAQEDSMILSVIEQILEQMINNVNNWEKANKEQNNESLTAKVINSVRRGVAAWSSLTPLRVMATLSPSLGLLHGVEVTPHAFARPLRSLCEPFRTMVTAELERYKERVKTFEQRLNIDLDSRKKMIDSQMGDMIKEKLALKEQVDSLEQNLSKQIKEKECLLQTYNVFKSESKEKEDKYTENEIDLEKKIKELDNILFKVGQSAQTVHILSDDFGKRFTPQQELLAEQAFWLRMSNPTSKPSDASFVKIEAPKELPKIGTPNARTEGEWGFEHTKAVFNNEIIPFLKSLKDIFNLFDRDLLNEIREVQTVFDQMDAVVQQSSVDKQCLEIAKKELLLENDRLLQQVMSHDVLLTVMNSMSFLGEYVNMDGKRKESCNLEAELLKSQNAFNDLLKSYSQLEKHCISLELSIQLNQEIFQKDESCNNQNALEILEFFENNDLKAQLKDKESTICKLKDIIKSMKEKSKEKNVNYDYGDIRTKNVELKNSVANLISENERLCNEINHVKQVFKEQFNSIKKTRVRTKEQSDSLIDKLNLKSAENEDLKAQIQDKEQADILREIVDIAA
ncbi:hypothetical protein Tco_0741494 [Tanacetum coccineum]